jgi:hypothetical protein
MISEEIILNFFQLPDETVKELRIYCGNNGLDWLIYLNELYNEFVFT